MGKKYFRVKLDGEYYLSFARGQLIPIKEIKWAYIFDEQAYGYYYSQYRDELDKFAITFDYIDDPQFAVGWKAFICPPEWRRFIPY